MNHAIVNLPHSRNWRDIPQHVKPRAMSREGRWRHATASARVVGIALATVVVAWGAWEVVAALQENSKKMPAAAKAVPLKNFALKTDGVLDASWLARALALPKDAALMELDLQQLRARLLADGQVRAASLTRVFPDTLEVSIAERRPVARMQVAFRAGDERTLLVASDGVTFAGAGYKAELLDALPWLDGVKLLRTKEGGRFLPIAGMDVVADLLDVAQRETARLYQAWHTVSLAHLESDGEIEVRTKAGTVIVFGARTMFLPQLAKLDYQWDALANAPVPPTKIDLSLGREVPVTFAPPTAAGAPAPVFSGFLNPQPKSKREL